MSETNNFKVNINPYNHETFIGKIDQKPEIYESNKPGGNRITLKINIRVPRNYLNHNKKTGKLYRGFDDIKGSCLITKKQASFYKSHFKIGKWAILRGETLGISYVRNGKRIFAHPFNLENAELYHVPHTQETRCTQQDKAHITAGVKGLDWIRYHPGLVRKFAPNAYKWLMAHDAFVLTHVDKLPKTCKLPR